MNARFRAALRLAIALIFLGAPFLAVKTPSPGWMAAYAALPPLFLLAFYSPAWLYAGSSLALALGALFSFLAYSRVMDNSVGPLQEAVGPLVAESWGSLATLVVVAAFCHRFLNAEVQKRHAERQAMEELEDETARLVSEIQNQEKALARNENKRKRYSRLQDAAKELAATLEVEKLGAVVLEKALQVLQEKPVSVTLAVFDGSGKELHRRQGGNQAPTANAASPEDALNQWVISRGSPLIIKDLEKDFRFRGLNMGPEGPRFYYVSPLLSTQGQVTGLVRVEAHQKDCLDTEDQRLMESLVILSSLALENAKLYKETQELAITDGLTKLFLRRPLLERLDEEFKRSSQTQSPLAFILLDIDHFKSVNDTYGHPAGDKVLREIALMVKKRVRDVDLCGRYGGEEFAVLLPETDAAGAQVVAERIREGIRAQPFELRGEKRTITVSLGISSYPKDAKTVEGLIEKADEALYRSKESGRDRVTLSGDM